MLMSSNLCSPLGVKIFARSDLDHEPLSVGCSQTIIFTCCGEEKPLTAVFRPNLFVRKGITVI